MRRKNEKFEEFDDAPNRQRQAKCFNRFKSTPPSEYIQFTEIKKQATFLKKDISGKLVSFFVIFSFGVFMKMW